MTKSSNHNGNVNSNNEHKNLNPQWKGWVVLFSLLLSVFSRTWNFDPGFVSAKLAHLLRWNGVERITNKIHIFILHICRIIINDCGCLQYLSSVMISGVALPLLSIRPHPSHPEDLGVYLVMVKKWKSPHPLLNSILSTWAAKFSPDEKCLNSTLLVTSSADEIRTEVLTHFIK